MNLSQQVTLVMSQDRALTAVVHQNRAVVLGTATQTQDFEQVAQTLRRIGVTKIDCAVLNQGDRPTAALLNFLQEFDSQSVLIPKDFEEIRTLRRYDFEIFTHQNAPFSPLGAAGILSEETTEIDFKGAKLLKFSGGCDILTSEQKLRLSSQQSPAVYRFALLEENHAAK